MHCSRHSNLWPNINVFQLFCPFFVLYTFVYFFYKMYGWIEWEIAPGQSRWKFYKCNGPCSPPCPTAPAKRNIVLIYLPLIDLPWLPPLRDHLIDCPTQLTFISLILHLYLSVVFHNKSKMKNMKIAAKKSATYHPDRSNIVSPQGPPPPCSLQGAGCRRPPPASTWPTSPCASPRSCRASQSCLSSVAGPSARSRPLYSQVVLRHCQSVKSCLRISWNWGFISPCVRMYSFDLTMCKNTFYWSHPVLECILCLQPRPSPCSHWHTPPCRRVSTAPRSGRTPAHCNTWNIVCCSYWSQLFGCLFVWLLVCFFCSCFFACFLSLWVNSTLL